ncbi:MAG: hypothetical protein ACYTDX_02435 [Planctomycetota bacterium]|jgi:hypothetical protein
MEGLQGTGKAGKSVDPIVWKAGAVGLVLTIAAFIVPVLSIVFHGMITLIHEMGHALAAWCVGQPATPAFDFQYGGGVTAIQRQSSLMLWFLYAAWAALAFKVRGHRKSLVAVIVGFALWWLFAHSGLRSDWISFMGHGTELVIATVFLYRALSGASILDEQERPLYAALGTFITVWDGWWALQLIVDESARSQYMAGKGNIHANDFVLLARSWGVDLSFVAFLFMLCCLLPPVIAGALFWWDDEIAAWWKRWRGEA